MKTYYVPRKGSCKILNLIKQRAAVRKFKNKPIPQNILDSIIEAGIWGPSVTTFLRLQPWRFIVVKNKKLKSQIVKKINEKSNKAGTGVNILLRSSANTIKSAEVIIAIYNSGETIRLKKKLQLIYKRFANILENSVISVISATIQNMVLTARSLGVDSCWLDTPLFCEKEINKILHSKHRLIAILALGYPAERGIRAPRKPLNESIHYKL